MFSSAPATKLNEVFSYFVFDGLKNLSNFGEVARKKLELKNSLEQLKKREPFDAYTGLGIIANYDNQFDLALDYFKKAYVATNHNLSASMNYAHNLFFNMHFEQSNKIYVQTIKDYPNNLKLFNDVINSLERYYFIEECEAVLEYAKGIDSKTFDDKKNEVQSTKDDLVTIKKMGIDINFLRQYLNAIEKIYFKKFTYHSELIRETIVDSAHQIIWYSIQVKPNLEDVNAEVDLLSEMNESLQMNQLEVIKNSPDPLVAKKMAQKLCFYFTLADKVDA